MPETASSEEVLQALSEIPGLLAHTSVVQVTERSSTPERVSAAEFLLEGLAGVKKISRNDERGYHRNEERQPEVGFEEPLDHTKSHLN